MLWCWQRQRDSDNATDPAAQGVGGGVSEKGRRQLRKAVA